MAQNPVTNLAFINNALRIALPPSAYVRGPIQVIGADVHDLDRDNDGVACEWASELSTGFEEALARIALAT